MRAQPCQDEEASWLKNDWSVLQWSPWVSLLSPLGSIPSQPGLYRVKASDSVELMYIGQTGLSLRSRIQQLRAGLMWAEMPFNDPHTATPNLWCYRVESNLSYEVSAAPFLGSKPDRMATECFLLWQYRLARGESSLCNFGHFHSSFSKSGNRKTGKRGLRIEGEPISRVSFPALQPIGSCLDIDWLGLEWTGWRDLSVEGLRTPAVAGLYRLRCQDELVYIGETDSLASRLRTHSKSISDVEFSFHLLPGSSSVNRREWESDAIGAYFSVHGRAPKRQFGSVEVGS